MKKTLITLMLTASALAAQTTTTAQPNAYLMTVGIWPLCDAGIQLQGCSTAGPMRYNLVVQASGGALTTAFHYKVKYNFTDGTSLTFEDVALRKDNTYGWTVIPMPTLPGDLKSLVIAEAVEELVVKTAAGS